MLKAVVFDVDGTLVDSVGLHAEGFLYALKKLGIEVNEDIKKQFLSLVGKTLKDIVEEMGYIDMYEDIKRLKHEYVLKNIYRIKPIIDPSVIKELCKKYKLGIFSSSSPELIKAILEHLHIEHCFGVVVSDADVKHGKPHPEGLIKVINELGVSPRETLYVGDKFVDMLAAKNAGTEFMFVEEFVKTWTSLL